MLKLLSQCAICHQAESILCNQCQRHLNIYDWKLDLSDMWNLDWIVIGRHYDHIIRHLVHRLKYGRGKAIAKILWIKLATLISTTNLMDLIQLHPWQVVITAVPTHRVNNILPDDTTKQNYSQKVLHLHSSFHILNFYINPAELPVKSKSPEPIESKMYLIHLIQNIYPLQ